MKRSLAFAVLGLAACASNNSETKPDAAPDAPPPFAEAPHATAPQMVKMSGDVLATPKVVPIFFQNDATMQAQVEQFLTLLGGSDYWTATTSEYGVGTLQIEPTIVTTDAPPTSDTALDTWLKGHFNGQNGWPAAPDPQAIYSVFLPAGVVLHTQFGDSCQAFGAYHDEATTATNQSVVYALMPRCPGGIDELSASTSHELIEAVTDPRVETTPAYGDVDHDHYIWAYTPGAEVGDMCEYVDAAYQRLVGNYLVQRTWSNAAAAAGHDPCVPAAAGAIYYAAAPLLNDPEPLDSIYGGTITTKGVKVALNQSATIEVDLFSDQPYGLCSVSAADIAQLGGGTAELAFSWDKENGQNGDKLHLTITRKANGMGQGSEFALLEKDAAGNIVALWFGFVSN